MTAPRAPALSHLTQVRFSPNHVQRARITVRKPTKEAIKRWLCSKKIPPTHFEYGNVNMFQPYVVGQSGTLKPDCVLVTRPPRKIRNAVQQAVKRANRWRLLPSPSGEFAHKLTVEQEVPSSVEEGRAEAAKREPDRAKHGLRPRLGWCCSIKSFVDQHHPGASRHPSSAEEGSSPDCD